MSKNLKAVVTAQNQNARQPDGKEMLSCWNLVILNDGKLKNVITVRTYSGRSASASVVYACVWIHGNDGIYLSGRGSAGGGGYHKESQAIADAFSSAGIQFYGSFRERDDVDMKRQCSFGGTGDSYYEAAFLAVARAVGYRGSKFILIHN